MTGDVHAPRISGKRWVQLGIVIVLAISAFVIVRIVQVSGPGPDPDTIPARPGTRAAPPDSL